MASETSLLIPEFREPLLKCIDIARKEGINIQVLTTVVTPMEQAALWKQGRSRVDAELKALALRNAKANYLAECLDKALPLETNIVTDLLPGYSWHQWGEAANIVWVDGLGKLIWETKGTTSKNKNGYKVFADLVTQKGLHSGGETDESDKGLRHVRFRPHPTARDKYSLVEIDAEMKKRFSR